MMKRREFVQLGLKAALAVSAAGTIPLVDVAVGHARPYSALLAVRTDPDIPRLVRETVQALGGMQRFVKPGETVIVKPNIGWDRTMAQAANTHPLVVRTTVELCLEAGAAKVWVFDNSANDPRRCYINSGIKPEVEGITSDRVTIEYMNPRGYRDIDIRDGVGISRWFFYRRALEADRFINLPIAKHHSHTVLTLGMKNIMGVIGGERGVLHRKMADCLVDINSVIRSDLTIVDATRILLRNGPQGGRIEDVQTLNTLIASPDIIAADSYAATLFNLSPQDVPAIVAGAKRGLGVMDLSRITKV